jgi:hypothetical protein
MSDHLPKKPWRRSPKSAGRPFLDIVDADGTVIVRVRVETRHGAERWVWGPGYELAERILAMGKPEPKCPRPNCVHGMRPDLCARCWERRKRSELPPLEVGSGNP